MGFGLAYGRFHPAPIFRYDVTRGLRAAAAPLLGPPILKIVQNVVCLFCGVQGLYCVVSYRHSTPPHSTSSTTYSPSTTLTIQNSCSREFPSSFCPVFSSQWPFNFTSTRSISHGLCCVPGDSALLNYAHTK